MNAYALDEVRTWLSCFVEAQAVQARQRLGFGWRSDPAAPDTYEALCSAFKASQSTGSPLPVATVNVEPSVFVSAEVNSAMRFWHDVSHVELDADFKLPGEQRVADLHLQALEAAGRPAGSLEWTLLRADTVGQNLVFAMTKGGFVADQWAFALSVLRWGLPMAVLEAVQAIQEREIASSDVAQLRVLMEPA